MSEKHLPHDDLQQSVFICTDLIQSIEYAALNTR